MNFFNQSITRTVVTAFMDFFSKFSIEKYQTISVSGNDVFVQRKIIPVPIQYSTREKFIEIIRSSSARKAMDPSIRDKNTVEMQWILPRISCNINGIVYDPNRRLIKTQKIDDYPNNTTTGSTKSNVYSPSTYNLEIEISTISRNIDENLQLLEQIIPYFSPTMSMNLKLYPDKESESIPIVLNSISMDNPTDIPEFEERVFTNVYNFTVKMNYYMQKRLSNTITGMTIGLVNGQEVIQLDKSWADSLNNINNKFTQYIANSSMANPLVNNTVDPLSLIGNITLLAIQNPDNTITLISPELSANQYSSLFTIVYRLDDDMTTFVYTNPIPITFNTIYFWLVYSNKEDAKQFPTNHYTVI